MAIGGRTGRIKSAAPPNPGHIYKALMIACTALDVVDIGAEPYVSSTVAVPGDVTVAISTQ